jgi:hypothetical protein
MDTRDRLRRETGSVCYQLLRNAGGPFYGPEDPASGAALKKLCDQWQRGGGGR